MWYRSISGMQGRGVSDPDVVILVDDDQNPIIWDETSDSGGILLD